MTDSSKIAGQPALAELMARFLNRQAAAHAAGIAIAGSGGEAVPYEAVPVQPVDPRLAWDGAGEAIRCFQQEPALQVKQAPAEWATLVAGHEPAGAIAFCAGNFPQLVRDIHSLLKAGDLSGLRPGRPRPVAATALADWATQLAETTQLSDLLLALGICRLARQFERAGELLKRYQVDVPSEWQAAWSNEEAALAWHRGESERADVLWQKQAPSAPVLFNRGMSALFLNRAREARAFLNQAVNQLADDSAWHHLGRLYLALAEMRG